jgi:hypothetical protein
MTKQEQVKNAKAQASDWIRNILLGLVFWLVKDIYSDVKGLIKIIPVHELRISNLEDAQRVNRLKDLTSAPMKQEEIISLDSLTRK